MVRATLFLCLFAVVQHLSSQESAEIFRREETGRRGYSQKKDIYMRGGERGKNKETKADK